MSSVEELPIGTVTFLFTDIEGSTQLLKQLRDRYGEALTEHQRILREAFAEHGGHQIDTQGGLVLRRLPACERRHRGGGRCEFTLKRFQRPVLAFNVAAVRETVAELSQI